MKRWKGLVKHQVGVIKRPLEVMALDDEYWGELLVQAGSSPVSASLDADASAPAAAVNTTATPTLGKPTGLTL